MEREKLRIFIPNPHGKDIGFALLLRIIADVGISYEKFKNA